SSSVGSNDLQIINNLNNKNVTLEKLKNNDFDVLFLFGQDNINIDKKNQFIIYVGSHGDYGAEKADVILPGSAYTEQDAHYTNLEGKLQKSFKASYPPGEAKEDWEIINILSQVLDGKTLFKSKEELVIKMKSYLNSNNNKSNDQIISFDFIDEIIKVENTDYYFSNVIARSSKTMAECRDLKIKMSKTGTDG
ncbi:MAG: molybdopterin-dependent oxidoreductase, partial [Candidatus Pelagibacter sp.]